MNTNTTSSMPPQPQDLPSLCLRLLSLLAAISTYGGLRTADTQLFQQLWNAITQRAQGLPQPSPGRRAIAGTDNYDRFYNIAAGVYLPNGSCFERRVFCDIEKTGYFFSHPSLGFFYYNPDGDFYASYTEAEVGCTGRVSFAVRGVKLSQLGVTTYTYPPDIPARLRGGSATRYFA